MRRPPTAFGVILGINLKMIYAAFLALIAYIAWPTSPEWWGFGFISICAGLSSVIAVVQASRDGFQLWLRDREAARFLGQGGAPKGADLAREKTLRDSGMIK